MQLCSDALIDWKLILDSSRLDRCQLHQHHHSRVDEDTFAHSPLECPVSAVLISTPSNPIRQGAYPLTLNTSILCSTGTHIYLHLNLRSPWLWVLLYITARCSNPNQGRNLTTPQTIFPWTLLRLQEHEVYQSTVHESIKLLQADGFLLLLKSSVI